MGEGLSSPRKGERKRIPFRDRYSGIFWLVLTGVFLFLILCVCVCVWGGRRERGGWVGGGWGGGGDWDNCLGISIQTQWQ